MVRRFGIPVFLLVAFAAALLTSVPTHAGDFGCGPYVWSSPYPADLSDLYNVGAIRLPPYFSMHPPVYYEMPIPRTYGYGPWAYPPYVTTPEIVEPTPEIIQNKYVPHAVKQESAKPKVASAPKVIRNPYVTPIDKSEQSGLAAR